MSMRKTAYLKVDRANCAPTKVKRQAKHMMAYGLLATGDPSMTRYPASKDVQIAITTMLSWTWRSDYNLSL